MKIVVFGTDCIGYFAGKGIFVTPGLVIRDEVVAAGQLLSVEEIKTKIKERM